MAEGKQLLSAVAYAEVLGKMSLVGPAVVVNVLSAPAVAAVLADAAAAFPSAAPMIFAVLTILQQIETLGEQHKLSSELLGLLCRICEIYRTGLAVETYCTIFSLLIRSAETIEGRTAIERCNPFAAFISITASFVQHAELMLAFATLVGKLADRNTSREALGGDGIVVLHTSLLANEDREDICCAVFGALAALSQNTPLNQEFLVTAKVPPTLASVASRHLGSSAVSAALMELLRPLSANRDQRPQLFPLPLVEALAAILRRWTLNDAIQSLGLWVLRLLAGDTNQGLKDALAAVDGAVLLNEVTARAKTNKVQVFARPTSMIIDDRPLGESDDEGLP
eukprot:Amastigsp_a676970_15.p1 type:complete len:339 gc:universal Amastigsp_a676970_15:1106-90(-)